MAPPGPPTHTVAPASPWPATAPHTEVSPETATYSRAKVPPGEASVPCATTPPGMPSTGAVSVPANQGSRLSRATHAPVQVTVGYFTGETRVKLWLVGRFQMAPCSPPATM